jgi:hypothetical protein
LSTNLQELEVAGAVLLRASDEILHHLLGQSHVALSRSQKAISGSIIQNSAAWREVFEFSARKVGPKV